MTTTTRSALLAGATGLIGSHLLRELLTNPTYARVVVCTRRPLIIATNLRLVSIVKPLDQLRASDVGSIDDYYCALGTTIKKAGSQSAFQQVDRDLPVQVGKVALAARAARCMIVSSVGANPNSSNFYLRTKGEMEDHLSTLAFQAIHAFRPSILVGERAESRPGESFGIAAAVALQWAMIGSLRRYRPISATIVAEAMVAAAGLSVSGYSVHEYDAIMRLAAST